MTANGELRFLSPPDDESPSDDDEDNDYEVTLTAADRETGGETTTLNVTVSVTPVDEPPAIAGERVPNFLEEGTDPVGIYTVSDPEGQTTVFTWRLAGTDRNLCGTEVGSFVATEPDGDDLKWSVAGIDGGHFEMREISGSWTLSFKANPDYDNPLDTNLAKRNTYHVTVRAIEVGDQDSRTTELTGSLDVLVIVTDIDERPVIMGPTSVTDFPENSRVTREVGRYSVSDPEGESGGAGHERG